MGMMRSRVPRILVTILFVGLIAVPIVLKRYYKPAADGKPALDTQAALARYGFRLEEVAKSCGVDFTHTAPHLDAKLDHIMPQVASMGAAVSVVDFDRDGWPDLYVTNSGEGSMNCLYRNLGNGQFKDVAAEVGLADLNREGTGVSMGAVWGDYDNDGYDDVFVYKWGRPELFHNDGGRGFTRVTDKVGLPPWVNANTAIWFDYDRDGKLDLFVGGYYAENIDLWHLQTTKIMPESFEYAQNGGRKYLFHNLGNGQFVDVSATAGVDSASSAAAGRSRPSPRTCAARATLTSSSRTTTACPSFSLMMAANASARSARPRASASRPRAA